MLHAVPYGWGIPPADAFGFGMPYGPLLPCGGPPPGTWGGCGCGRPGCLGCPAGYAAAAMPHDYLREVAALAAAAAALGLPIPPPPQPLAPQPQMAFMPVAEAGGRGSKEGDADAARMEGEGQGSDCEGSTDGSEEGLAAGATAARLPHSPSTVAAAATAAMEEAAAAAAVAVRSLAGFQGPQGLGGSQRTWRRTYQAADQLPGELPSLCPRLASSKPRACISCQLGSFALASRPLQINCHCMHSAAIHKPLLA